MSSGLVRLTEKRLGRLAKFLVVTVFCFATTILCGNAVAAFSWEPTNGPHGGHIFHLAVNAGGHIFAASETNGVFRSTDNGSSWTQVTSAEVDPLAINSSGHIFAGTQDGVLISTDNGDNWSSTGLSAHGIVSLVINSSDHIFAGNYFGDVYRSTDNGANWTAVNSGLMYTNIRSLAVIDSNIFAGTYGGGVCRRPLSEMVDPVNTLVLQEMQNQAHLKVNPTNRADPMVQVECTIPQSELAAS